MRAAVRTATAAVAAALAAAAGLQFSGVLDLVALAQGSGDYEISVSPQVIDTFNDSGNHCRDCVTTLTLPFPYRLYDQTFSSVNVSSNGNLQFTSPYTSPDNVALPAPGFSYAIFPLWDDLRTDAGYVPTGETPGVYWQQACCIGGTQSFFIIEWRAVQEDGGGYVKFQTRLYQNERKFDVVYLDSTNSGTSATVGVQGTTRYGMYSFNQPADLAPDARLTFVIPPVPTAITVTHVAAQRRRDGVLVRWRTSLEAGVLGFKVWRRTGGRPLRKLSALVPAKGALKGAPYSWLDRTARPGVGYTYRIEALEQDGARAFVGTASVPPTR